MGEKLDAALKHLDELAGEPRRFRVSIPANERDSDLILMAGYKEQGERIAELEAERDQYSAAMMAEENRAKNAEAEVERMREERDAKDRRVCDLEAALTEACAMFSRKARLVCAEQIERWREVLSRGKGQAALEPREGEEPQ